MGIAVGHDQTVCSSTDVSVLVLRLSLEDTEVVLFVVVDMLTVRTDVVVEPAVMVTAVGV